MPQHQLLDKDFEYFKGTLYSCRQEYEMGTEPHFKSKKAAHDYADVEEIECEPLIEEWGIWVRITRIGYDLSWHGPFSSVEEATDFVNQTWDPVRTGYKMADDLDGVPKQLPAWVRR